MLAHFEASSRRFERLEAESDQQTPKPTAIPATDPVSTQSEARPEPVSTTPQAPAEDNFKRPAEKQRKRKAASATMTKAQDFPKIENLEELLHDIDLKITPVSEDGPKDPRKVML